MRSALALKLHSFADLSADDRIAIDRLSARTLQYKAGRSLIKEGDRPEEVFLLLEGWACRYKILPDGGRQIMALLLPGDLCDIHIFILKTMDHGISLLSDAKVAAIPREAMLALLSERSTVAQALFWATLVDEAALREWLVNVGQREAYARIAHLFCELWLRLGQVGLVSNRGFYMPLTQEQIGDALGLTSIHVNRTLQRLRAEGLISLVGRQLNIDDLDRLRAVADFNPNYLHLDRRLTEAE